jgi:hypothetical protein
MRSTAFPAAEMRPLVLAAITGPPALPAHSEASAFAERALDLDPPMSK